MMGYQGTKLYSILHAKCPKCHQGDFFETSNPYNLKKFDKMYNRCAVCAEDFERETGFYYGAMYVSYALTVAFGVALYVAMCVVFNFGDIAYLIMFATLQLLFMPFF